MYYHSSGSGERIYSITSLMGHSERITWGNTMTMPPEGQVGGWDWSELGQGSNCLRHKLLRWRFDDDGRSKDPCPCLKGIWK